MTEHKPFRIYLPDQMIKSWNKSYYDTDEVNDAVEIFGCIRPRLILHRSHYERICINCGKKEMEIGFPVKKHPADKDNHNYRCYECQIDYWLRGAR